MNEGIILQQVVQQVARVNTLNKNKIKLASDACGLMLMNTSTIDFSKSETISPAGGDLRFGEHDAISLQKQRKKRRGGQYQRKH